MWNGLPGLFLKLELGNVYNTLNYSMVNGTDVSNTTGVRTTMNVFVCPSNRRAITTPPATTPPSRTSSSGRRTTGGAWPPDTTRGSPRNTPAGRPTRPIRSIPPQSPQNLGIFDNGLAYLNSTVSLADVNDGSSNTILMGETLTGTWAEATSCCIRTTIDRQVNKPIQIGGLNSYTYWMSKHPGIVNFLKCDGSVATVTNQINRLVLVKMMTRAGGERSRPTR